MSKRENDVSCDQTGPVEKQKINIDRLEMAQAEKAAALEQNEEKGMTIVDLNDDCLEVIFNYLDRDDLVNLVEASPRFESVAARVFKRKYSNLNISISNWHVQKYMKQLNGVQSNAISESTVLHRINARYLRIIRNFGHLLSSINTCAGQNSLDGRLLDEIVQLCGKNLFKFSINNGSLPDNGYWCAFLHGLSSNFPKLRDLEFSGSYKDYFLDLHFPNLEHLSVDVHSQCRESSVKKIILLHPQLKTIVLYYSYPQKLMAEMIEILREKCPNLRRLELFFFKIDPDFQEFGRKGFENLTDLTFSARIHQRNYLELFGISGSKLERLDISLTKLSESLFEAITQFKMVKVLRVLELNQAQLMTLAKNLPELKEIDMRMGSLGPQGVQSFLKRCENLNKTTICFRQQIDVDSLNEWIKVLNTAEWKTWWVHTQYIYIVRRQ